MRLGLGLGLGSQSTRGDSGVSATKYLFIDGGCLRATIQAISKSVCGNEDRIRPLFPSIGAGFRKSYFYDAIPAQEHGEDLASYERRVETAHGDFDRIRSLDRFHVALGEIKGRKGNRRQKQVDVRLAVDMLSHAFRGNFAEATLLAGDDDFIPLVEALVREGVEVTIWHPSQASEQLLAVADNRREFSLATAHSLLTVDGVSQAFRHSSSGGGQMSQDQTQWSAWNEDGISYLGRCTAEFVMIERLGLDRNAEFHRYAISGLSPEEAGQFFSAATGWPVNVEHLRGRAQL
jgi:uncharacterized LabA/DUF88 family protein